MDDIVEKIESMSIDFELKFSDVLIKLSAVEKVQNEVKDIAERNDRNLARIFERLETLDARLDQVPPATTQNQLFTREQIAQARDDLGLDLNQELVCSSLLFFFL